MPGPTVTVRMKEIASRCGLPPDHIEHLQFFREHFVKKGTEGAGTCMETLASLEGLATLGAEAGARYAMSSSGYRRKMPCSLNGTRRSLRK
jgi:hypothetical protein